MDILDFEDMLAENEAKEFGNITMPHAMTEDFEVIEISESGRPIGVHRLNMEHLPYLQDHFDLEPLGQFTFRGRIGGSASTRGGVSGRASSLSTSKPRSTITGRSAAAPGGSLSKPKITFSRSLPVKTTPVKTSPIKRSPVISDAARQAALERYRRMQESGKLAAVTRSKLPVSVKAIDSMKKATTVPVKAVYTPSGDKATLVATPKLAAAGSMCGCKEMSRILALLEKADLQRTATDEHNIINNTSRFRRETLRKLGQIDARKGMRFPGREAIILAACGMGKNA